MALPELALPPAKIAIAGLTKLFATRGGPFTALDGISLDIPRGNFCTIVGPSGCGKTTLLRILHGLEPATRGTVSVAGRVVEKRMNSWASAFGLWPSSFGEVTGYLKVQKPPLTVSW